jgi:hypothetical protein
MPEKTGNTPEDEFDYVEDTGELPGRGRHSASEADLELLRGAIREHGRMMGELSGNLLALEEACRRNARNIMGLARRLGFHADGGKDREEGSLAQTQPKESPSKKT